MGGSLEESYNLFCTFVLVMLYPNVDTDKLKILKDNKGKSGIYLWTHLESNKRYIGSGVDLTKRLNDYFLISYLNRNKSMHICNALRLHGYSAFSLTILEYLIITNLSKENSKKLILSREQYYLNTLMPEYNILKVAGNLLGFKHSEETIAKMKGENNHMFGKTGENHPMFGRTGEKNPMFGKNYTHNANSKALISESKKGKTHNDLTKLKISISKKGIKPNDQTKVKMSIAQSTTIYVYSSDGTTLMNTFTSANNAGKFFNCSYNTILSYTKNGKLFKNKWILSTTVNKE
jgi:group I intron endonuclease